MAEEDNVPQAVRKQAQAADKLQTDLMAKNTADAALADGKTPAVPEVIDGTPIDQRKTPEPAPTKQEPAPQKPEDWKHKYDVLQGKYNAEIPRMKDQIDRLSGQLDKSIETIDRLNNVIEKVRSAEPAQSQPTAPPEDAGELKVSDYEGYGEEIVALVKRLNRLIGKQDKPADKADDTTKRLEAVEERTINTARMEFARELTGAIPNWIQVNDMIEWRQWLNEADPVSGYRRQDIIDAAQDRLDAGRVVNVMRAFMREYGLEPKAQAEPPQSSARESQVEPDTSSTGGGGPPKVPVVTAAQYQKAVADFAKRRITETEFNKVSDAYQNQLSA